MIETELSCCVTEGYSHGEFAVLKILQTVFKLTSASSMNAAANLRTKTANKNSLLDENEIRYCYHTTFISILMIYIYIFISSNIYIYEINSNIYLYK